MRRGLMLRGRSLRRLHQAESGAMAIFIALTTCFVVIPLGALAIDIGVQRVSRVDAQAVADTTALDMARLLVASGSASVTDSAATTAAATTSGSIGNGMTVHVYTGTLSSTFVSDQSLGCNGTTSNSYFTSPASNPTAVLVTVSNSVNFAIHGGSGGVCRSSLATASQRRACVMMDSYAAALNTEDSSVLGPLNKALGTNFSTTVLGSSGILTANLNVLDFMNALQTQLSLGSTTAVLAANVTAAQVLQAEETALTSEGLLQSAGLLQGVNIPAAGTMTVSGLLGSMGISQGGASGLATTVNPLDLAMATAQLANGSSALAVLVTSPPGVGLTSLSAAVTVGSRPQLVCLGDSPATKTMAQTSITAALNLSAAGTVTGAVTNLVSGLTSLLSNVVGSVLGLLGSESYTIQTIALSNAQNPLTAKVSLAAASGKVNNLTCSGFSPTAMSVQEGASLAPATITIPLILTAQHKYNMVLGLGGSSETATAIYSITISTVPTTDQSVAATFNLPGDFDKPKNGPSNNLSVQYASATVTNLVPGAFAHGGKTVDGLFGLSTNGTSLLSLVNTVNGLAASVESVALAPLLTTLTSTLQSTVGTTIAGSTYTALSKLTSCGSTPRLAG